MFKWLTKNDSPPPPLLDEDFLSRLADHLGTVAVTELMADAMLELTDRLSELQDCADAGDVPRIGRITHDIAGIAGHMGLTRMSHHAVYASRMAEQQGRKADGPTLIAPILDCRDASIGALGTYCDGPLTDARSGGTPDPDAGPCDSAERG